MSACAEGPAVTANSTVASPDDPAAVGATAQLTVIAKGTALPGGYKIDPSRTMIFGTDEKWTGRMTYTATGSAD